MADNKHTWDIQGYMGRKTTVTGYRVAEHFGVAKVPGVRRWVVYHLASGCRISEAAADKLTTARANAEKLATLTQFDWAAENPFGLGHSDVRGTVMKALADVE